MATCVGSVLPPLLEICAPTLMSSLSLAHSWCTDLAKDGLSGLVRPNAQWPFGAESRFTYCRAPKYLGALDIPPTVESRLVETPDYLSPDMALSLLSDYPMRLFAITEPDAPLVEFPTSVFPCDPTLSQSISEGPPSDAEFPRMILPRPDFRAASGAWWSIRLVTHPAPR